MPRPTTFPTQRPFGRGLRPRWAALLALAALLSSACQSPPPTRIAADPELAIHSGEGVELRTDLPEPEAKVWLTRLELLHGLLDQTLPASEDRDSGPALCLILGDAARFALYAQARQVDPSAGAFVTPLGEVVYRYRPDDWLSAAGAPSPLEPRSRPLSAALLRARLLRRYGPDLRPTWVEEGLAQRFAILAAEQVEGRPPGADTQARQTLIDAFLPLYLGAPPVLGEILAARGRDGMRKAGSSALARAGVTFLSQTPTGGEILAKALADAAEREGAEEAFQAALEASRGLERPFERYLLDQTVTALLQALRDAPTPVDRWESAAVLRLVANLDLDPDLPDAARAHQVDAAFPLLEQNPPPVRFLDRYGAELQALHGRRSQLEAIRRLQRRIEREFTRRTQGYGHPAIEPARKGLGKALQRAYREAGAGSS